MHYGWLLPQSVQDRILLQAEARNDLCHVTFYVPQESDGELHATRIVDRQVSMELLVDDLIKDLKLNIPVLQFINSVFTNTESGDDLCLTVYTNHVGGNYRPIRRSQPLLNTSG